MNAYPTILILGGGYLGSRLFCDLIDKGASVILADKEATRCSGHRYQVDLTCDTSVARLADSMGQKPDAVIMCASSKGGGADACRKLYCDGARSIHAYFAGALLLFCSSSSVYGVTDGRWVEETHRPAPSDAAGAILLDAEQIILGSGGVVARLSAVYGPGRCVLAERFYREGAAIHGAGDRWVNYIHRDDAVSALSRLATTPRQTGGIYNVSDGNPMQLDQIYEQLGELMGRDRSRPECSPSGPVGRRGRSNQRVSSALLRSLGWQPKYPNLIDGVRSMIDEWI